MTDLNIGMVIVLVIAICQAIKYAGVNTRFIPIIALVLGMGGAFFFEGVSWLATVSGIVLGLTSSGLFSGFKATILNK